MAKGSEILHVDVQGFGDLIRDSQGFGDLASGNPRVRKSCLDVAKGSELRAAQGRRAIEKTRPTTQANKKHASRISYGTNSDGFSQKGPWTLGGQH
jgi:hypothetical protein